MINLRQEPYIKINKNVKNIINHLQPDPTKRSNTLQKFDELFECV